MSFAYDKKVILNDLNFQISKNKITTLMGANGCGKSTLLQLISKNLNPKSGMIYIGNQNIAQVHMKEFAKKVAIVHQYNTAPEDLTVEQLVYYGRTPYEKFNKSKKEKELDNKKVKQAMQITGVLKFKDRSVQSLSGGQKQRVWIAMALAQGTKILLLDEPTTYLDVRYQLQILRLVRALNRQCGITIIMVLHDINQAISYSDEVIALSQEGTIIAQGETDQVVVPEVISKMYGIDLEMTEINNKPFVITV